MNLGARTAMWSGGKKDPWPEATFVLKVTIPEGGGTFRSYAVSCEIGDIVVDWGDGSPRWRVEQPWASSSIRNTNHTYAEGGTYYVQFIFGEDSLLKIQEYDNRAEVEIVKFDSARMKKCETLYFHACSYLKWENADYSDVTSLKDISYIFRLCGKIAGQVPDITKLHYLTTCRYAYANCPNITSIHPNVIEAAMSASKQAATWPNLTTTDSFCPPNLRHLMPTTWGGNLIQGL